LGDRKLPAGQRKRVADILASTPDARAGRVLLGALEGETAPEVREHFLTHLKKFLPTKWKGLRQGGELKAAVDPLLGKSPTRPAGLALVGLADLKGAASRVAAIARDSRETLALRTAALPALGQLKAAEATEALGGLLEVGPESLRVEAV